MCGIAGEFGSPSSDEAREMLGRLIHRGPDDQGEVQTVGGWLGHRRLSIVDVEGGHQPLVNEAGDLWLVGNGEVYNHEDARADLPPGRFATRSDNEVALHLIEAHGIDALDRLEGMYAFLVAGDDGTFIAARDPVGIKPLYWAKRGGVVRFASEIRAFDERWLPFVESFPPGHAWTPTGGLVRFASAVPEDAAQHPGVTTGPDAPSRDELIVKTRETLIGAVHRQMMGDVPVGVFLSGGLDSSLIAAIAAPYLREHGERLKTFAVGLEGSPDVIAARVVAEHLNTEHREHVYTAADAAEAIEPVVRAIEHFDPSLVRSAVPNYFLAQMTAKHVKVVLTGEGADELFAGYEYLSEIDDPDELQREMVRTVESLHDLNLQRCDRVTMAHSLEARVPFLDRRVIAFALSLPPQWKLCGEDEPEKKLLRQAFEGWLPHDLLWREKAQFGDGSGAASVLTDHVSDDIEHHEVDEHDGEHLDEPLRTREELAYYRIYSEALPGIRAEHTVSRFATA